MLTVVQGNNGKQLLFFADLKDDENKNLDKELNIQSVAPEWIGQFIYIHNVGKEFYFQTNVDAPRNRVIKIDIEKPHKSNW